MPTLETALREHAFLAGLTAEHVAALAGCARQRHFEDGDYLFRTGQRACEFFLLRDGTVALELVAPGQPALVVATLAAGQIVGVSWLVAPYRWLFDARAAGRVRALAVDAVCLRGKFEGNHDLGYEMFRRIAPLLVKRLQATRLQLLNVYARH